MKLNTMIIIHLSILAATISCNKQQKSASTTPQSNISKKYPTLQIEKDRNLQTYNTTMKNEKMKTHHSQLVSGIDEDGSSVRGEVFIEGKAGLGLLTKEDNSTVDIVVEWSSTKKSLIGTDEYGYLYHLQFKKQ
jgi:hypothetical protein